MNMKLSVQQCESCRVGAPKIKEEELRRLLSQIPEWAIETRDDIMMLERIYIFKNYKLAWEFADKISGLAEQESHHPAILLEWGKVTVTWWSHAIKGLHKNDFICAAKTDALQV